MCGWGSPPGGPIRSLTISHTGTNGLMWRRPSLFSSRPLQPLHSNNELMSLQCMSFICLCVCCCVDHHHILGQRAPRAGFWGGHSQPLLALQRGTVDGGHRAPRTPPPRRFPPAELIPGLTNFTALAPTALSRHRFTLQPRYPPSPSTHHPSPAVIISSTPSLPLDGAVPSPPPPPLPSQTSVLIFTSCVSVFLSLFCLHPAQILFASQLNIQFDKR